MDINQPQEDVRRAQPELVGGDRLAWAVSGLCEEAGEVAGLLNKTYWRRRHCKTVSEDKWLDELGDVLWYLAQVANAKGYSLQEIWTHNQAKLEDRYGVEGKNT